MRLRGIVAKRLLGRVDGYNEELGWGFIVTVEWKRYWFHARYVKGHMPGRHHIVTFEPGPHNVERDCPEALNVRKVSPNVNPEFFLKATKLFESKKAA